MNRLSSDQLINSIVIKKKPRPSKKKEERIFIHYANIKLSKFLQKIATNKEVQTWI